MNKVYLLASKQTIDKDQQVVTINQVIRMEGYSYDNYVVYDINKDRWGVHYHLINLRTFDFDTSEIIRPLSQKFGIGMYYDEHKIVFKTDEEVAEILAKAKAKDEKEQVDCFLVTFLSGKLFITISTNGHMMEPLSNSMMSYEIEPV